MGSGFDTTLNARVDKTYGLGDSIPSGSDLNSYTENGCYHSYDEANTASLKNVPPSVKTGFRLEVKSISTKNFIKQYLYANSNIQRIYIRQIDNVPGGQVGDWYVSELSKDT